MNDEEVNIEKHTSGLFQNTTPIPVMKLWYKGDNICKNGMCSGSHLEEYLLD